MLFFAKNDRNKADEKNSTANEDRWREPAEIIEIGHTVDEANHPYDDVNRPRGIKFFTGSIFAMISGNDKV